jgi:hypothetical protein
MTFTANAPNNNWVLSNEYIVVDAQPITKATNWGIQIYTDNTNAVASPRFVDATPSISSNTDSDPAGLLLVPTGVSTTSVTMQLEWTIKDTTSTVPSPIRPAYADETGPPAAFTWFFMKDKGTPDIDYNNDGDFTDPRDGTAFQNGDSYMKLRKASGIHTSQGEAVDAYSDTQTPDYVYLGANYLGAPAQVAYRTSMLIVEFFVE